MNNPQFFLQDHKPHTTRLSFLKIPFNEMVLHFEQRLQELGLIWEWTVHHQKVSDELSLSDKIKMLEPFAQRYPNKYIILETASEWCLYMENGYRGTDVFSQPSYLSKTLGVQNISLYLSPDFKKDEFGAVMFHWRNGANKISEYAVESRTIMVHKETSKTTFEQSGKPFVFEDLASYEKRIKKERLTVDMVAEYCKHFNIDWFYLDFYKGRAALFTTHKK